MLLTEVCPRMPPPYEVLNDGEFRLVSLHDDSGLVCSLAKYRMDEAPPYIALSYTWGPPSSLKERRDSLPLQIILNDEDVEVQQNLYDALQTLASYVRAENCLFWIDALCINQGDLAERSVQVKAMQGIYEHSSFVFAWLGLPDDEGETRLAVQYMHDFRQRLLDIEREHPDYEEDAILAVVDQTFTQNHAAFPRITPGGTNEALVAWTGILKIILRNYWFRTWIYQEVTSPTSLRFFCGEHEFDEACLFDTMTVGQAFMNSPGDYAWLCASASTSFGTTLIIHARRRRWKGHKAPLIDLISEIKQTECSDPRDKVYAIIGQASDVTSGDILVDYNRSILDVYLDVAKFALFRANVAPFEALGHVYIPADACDELHPDYSTLQTPAVPSWIPDWRQLAKPVRFVDSSRRESNAPHLYTPWPGSPFDAQIHGRELEITAIVGRDLTVSSLTTIWNTKREWSFIRAWYDVLSTNGRGADLRSLSNDKAHAVDQAIRRCFLADRSLIGYTSEFSLIRGVQRGGMLDKALVEDVDVGE